MTDKEYEEQKKRVKRYIDKWYDTLGLGWWRVEMIWDRAKNEDMPDEAAVTRWQWQYRTASVTWRLPILAELDDEKLEGTVVHEFAHILTGAMVQNAPEENTQLMEYGTESVARALIWARLAGQKDKQRDKDGPAKDGKSRHAKR